MLIDIYAPPISYYAAIRQPPRHYATLPSIFACCRHHAIFSILPPRRHIRFADAVLFTLLIYDIRYY